MIFNDVFSYGSIIINIASLISSLITITVYRTKWQFVSSKKFRKARGTIRLNQTIFPCIFIVAELAVAFGVNRETNIGRNGCFAVLSFEAYFVLCLFSWTFNIVSMKEDGLRMLAWPTFEISHMFIIGYVSPCVIIAIFSSVLITKTSTFVQCSETALKTNRSTNVGLCTIENCDLADNFQSKILLAALFLLQRHASYVPVLLPIMHIVGGYFVEYIRRIRVAIVMWKLQEFNFKQIVENYSKRGELQVDLIYLLHHLWLIVILTVLVFVQQKHKSILKTIFSVAFSSMVIVILINECFMYQKEMNPLIWLEDWWKHRRRRRPKSNSNSLDAIVVTETRPVAKLAIIHAQVETDAESLSKSQDSLP